MRWHIYVGVAPSAQGCLHDQGISHIQALDMACIIYHFKLHGPWPILNNNNNKIYKAP